MRISARADYAVRAAVELASVGTAGWTKAERVADAQGIPLPFLLNILKSLREDGLVEAKRGIDGGYRLALPATEVSVAAVVRAVDGPLASVAGTLVEDREYSGSAVGLRDTWVALRNSIRSVLEVVMLADLVSGDLPASVTELLCGDDAFTTRPEVRERFERRGHRAAPAPRP